MKKKFLGVFLVAFIAVSSASAFQLGAFGGVTIGAYRNKVGEMVNAITGNKEDGGTYWEFWIAPNFYAAIPHNYGSSNWFGQGELGYISGFALNYNVGYNFHLGGDKFILAPYAGLGFSFPGGFVINAGAEFRLPLGIGDLTFDLRYNPSIGGFSRQTVAVNAGYIFLFGKDKRKK